MQCRMKTRRFIELNKMSPTGCDLNDPRCIMICPFPTSFHRFSDVPRCKSGRIRNETRWGHFDTSDSTGTRVEQLRCQSICRENVDVVPIASRT